MKKEIKKYTIEEAIKQLKADKKEKFDSTVELHINLDLDTKKQDQQVRFVSVLPHGTGKSLRVATFASTKIAGADLELTEADLSKIEKGELRAGRDFDVIVAEPRTMPKLAKVARILGPAGAMPNPKSGTVTDNVEKAIEQIKKGKVEVKTEQTLPIIHTIIGKCSFTDDALLGNFREVVQSLKHNRPQKAKPEWIKSMFLSSTMGKSYALELA